jgi:hypothetical protein
MAATNETRRLSIGIPARADGPAAHFRFGQSPGGTAAFPKFADVQSNIVLVAADQSRCR